MIFRSKPSSGLLIAMLIMVDEWWRMRERGGVVPYCDNSGVLIPFEVIDMERERDEILLYAIDR